MIQPSDVAPIDPVQRMLLDGKIEVLVPRSRVMLEKSIVAGRYNHYPLPARVRRVLDVGAGVGGFALWAWKKWAPVWIDCCEPDPVLRELLKVNAPPGVRILDVSGPAIDAEPYDLIRHATADYPLYRRSASRRILLIQDAYLS